MFNEDFYLPLYLPLCQNLLLFGYSVFVQRIILLCLLVRMKSIFPFRNRNLLLFDTVYLFARYLAHNLSLFVGQSKVYFFFSQPKPLTFRIQSICSLESLAIISFLCYVGSGQNKVYFSFRNQNLLLFRYSSVLVRQKISDNKLSVCGLE